MDESNLLSKEKNKSNLRKNNFEKQYMKPNFIQEGKSAGILNSKLSETKNISKAKKLNYLDRNENQTSIVNKTMNFAPFISSKWYNDVMINDLPSNILQE